MAIAPPPFGQPPQDEPAPPSADARMANINRHFHIMQDFSRAFSELMKGAIPASSESVGMRRVDGELSMSEDDYQEIIEVLGRIIPRLLDTETDIRKVLLVLLRVSGRQLPTHLQR